MAEAATPAQQMTRLLRSVEPIAFTLSVDQILKNFAELVGRLVNAQATQIFLWDERAEQFTLAHSTVSSSLNKGLVVAFKKGEGLAGFAGAIYIWYRRRMISLVLSQPASFNRCRVPRLKSTKSARALA